jgi:hypothetical protein
VLDLSGLVTKRKISSAVTTFMVLASFGIGLYATVVSFLKSATFRASGRNFSTCGIKTNQPYGLFYYNQKELNTAYNKTYTYIHTLFLC